MYRVSLNRFCTWKLLPSNSSHIVGSVEWKKCHPQIQNCNCRSLWMWHAYMCVNNFWQQLPHWHLGLFVLYELLLGLRDCMYYWQCLAVITVSLVHTIFSCHRCLWTFLKNKCHPRIVATQICRIEEIRYPCRPSQPHTCNQAIRLMNGLGTRLRSF